jgi:hypothetical protein
MDGRGGSTHENSRLLPQQSQMNHHSTYVSNDKAMAFILNTGTNASANGSSSASNGANGASNGYFASTIGGNTHGNPYGSGGGGSNNSGGSGSSTGSGKYGSNSYYALLRNVRIDKWSKEVSALSQLHPLTCVCCS